VLTTYDAPPSSGSFAGAHELGVATVTQSIVSGSSNAVAAVISGSIATISATPTYMSFPADGNAHTLAVVVTPADFDDNPITAGASNPYANPITATLTETGGSGHTTLIFDGKPSGTSATLAQSTDAVAIAYDGGGAAGYSSTLTLSATGAASEAVQLSPLYLSSASPYFASNAVAFTASTQTAALALSEANFSGAYTATPTGCSGIATATITASTVTIAAGSTVVGPGICSIAISDGISSIPIGVATTQTGSSVTIPASGITFTEFPTSAMTPWGIVPGPDGNMWFTDVIGDQVGKITPSGVPTLYSVPGGSEPFDIAVSDGNVWFSELLGNTVDKVTTSGTITRYSLGGSDMPYGFAAGPDGNFYYGTVGPANGIGRITTAAAITFWTIAGSSMSGVTAGPDGNVWFCDQGNNSIGKITTSGAWQEFPIPTLTANPANIVTGPDGNLWFTETNGNKIGKITTAGVITEYPVLTASAQPSFITVGGDGNLWFSEGTGNNIGRITTAGVVTEYPIPTAGSDPGGVAAGPNGTIWFTEDNSGKIGVLQY
jgi:streptogramin lyase